MEMLTDKKIEEVVEQEFCECEHDHHFSNEQSGCHAPATTEILNPVFGFSFPACQDCWSDCR